MRSPTIFEINADSLRELSCFDALYGQLQRAPQGLDRIAINMSSIDFVEPAGALALAMVVSEALQVAGSVELVHLQGDVPRYLERMDLLKLSESDRLVMPMDFVPFNRSQESTNLVEIQRIPPGHDPEHGKACKQTMSRMLKVLDAMTGDDDESERLVSMLNELVNNIKHSRDTGYVVVQKYHYRALGIKQVRIAVGDLGDGIKKSLGQRYNVTDLAADSDYIRRALEIYKDTPGGGKGLSRVDDLVNRWGGTLVVRSGNARVTIGGDAPGAEDGLIRIPGTQVEIVVRANSAS